MSVQLGLGLNRRLGGFNPFNPTHLNPYLLFDTRTSMLGELESPTLDLDPAVPSSLDVITATRSGVATYTDADGLIQTADPDTVRVDHVDGVPMMLIEPSATNLLEYSEDFSNSYWLKNDVTVSAAPVAAPDGTMTASHVVATGSNAHLVRINLVTSGSDKVSIWARTVSGKGTCFFNFHSGTPATVTEQWQRFEVTANTTHVYAVNFRGSATLDEIYIWGAQAETGSVATSYIPTSGSAVTRNADNLQIERDSTNLVNYSSPTLAQANTLNLTEDSGTYYGLSNWLEFGPASSGLAYIQFPEGGLLTGEHTLSFYIIMDDGGVPVVGSSSTGSGSDLSVLLEGNSTAGLFGVVTHVIGDMYRVSGVRTCASSSSSYQVRKYDNQSERGFKITGIQLEAGDMSSLIPTSGAPESRTTFSDFYNPTEGTVYFEGTSNSIVDPHLFSFSDGTTSNRVRIDINDGDNFRVLVIDGGSVIVNEELSFTGASVLFRAALSFKVNDLEGSLNGASVINETPASLPTVNKFYIGSNHDGSGNQLNGHIKRLIYWPTHSDSL